MISLELICDFLGSFSFEAKYPHLRIHMSSVPSTPNPFTILLECYIFYESITKIVEFNILENSFGMNNPIVCVVTIVSLPENKQIMVLFVR